jgi:hypothetical protein
VKTRRALKVIPPLLHFGYFDHSALAERQFRRRLEPGAGQLLVILHELFGSLPGRDMPGIGFFDHYGVLSCECPSVFSSVRLPVERVVEMVARSDCDVVYTYNGEYWLVSRRDLPEFLDPRRIPPEDVGLAEPDTTGPRAGG